MKSNVLLATREYLGVHLNRIVTFAGSVLLVGLASLAFTQLASAQTFSPITAQAGPGASGTNVRNIQTFLASNPSFYPEGLVTGYYGSLTQAAVQRFQAFYGIVSSGSPSSTGYGRVGPSTMAKMNALIAGGVPSSSDTTAPYIWVNAVTPSINGVSISWTTNESTTDTLYYDVNPIRFNEGDVNGNGFTVTSGQIANTSSGMSTSHIGSVANLSANTTYYYLIVSRDAAGNVSVSLPGATFRTTQ